MTRSISKNATVLLDTSGAPFRDETAIDHFSARYIGTWIGAALVAAGLVLAPATALRGEPINLALYDNRALFGAEIWEEPEGTRGLLLFWPRYESWWGDHGAFRHKHRHPHPRSEPAEKAHPLEASKSPLEIIISIADQRISLYNNGSLIARSVVSTGVRGHPTPLGVFSVIGKQRWHRSNIYSGAPMPYMQRITWSGVALHEGVLPGHPASHGCIRLTKDFAIRLWRLTKRGTRVIVAREDVWPVEIANPHLFVPKPKAASASPEAPVVSAGDGTVTFATTHAPSMSTATAEEARSLRVQGSAPIVSASQKIIPISVFVSRKLSKLFVRQGFTPLFNVRVNIERPEEPLGTHVFTVMEPQNENASVRWTVISMPEEFARAAGSASKERKPLVERTVESTPPAQAPDSANAALNRIEIPEEMVQRISELLTPGSSLTISDYGMSHETGRDTDFIVITH
jgi:L,D-transpeptidase catalytic domain